MYKIGELSKLSKIPVKTLRYYDSEGLLPPDRVDEFTGYRYYSAAKLSDCYRILAMKELGFTLEEIKAQFAVSRKRLSEQLTAKEQELLELKAQTERRIHILRKLASALEEDESMFDIVIRKSDEIRIAYKRRILSNRAEGKQVLEDMQSRIRERQLYRNGKAVDRCGELENENGMTVRRVVIDYETEFHSDSFDTGFGIELTGVLPKDCGLEEKIIRFTEDTASLICAENQYEEAVLALNQYVQENNYQVVGAVYQIIYGDGTVEVKLPVVKLYEFDLSRNESVDVPFENDERVIGKWELLDCLPSREMFHQGKRKSDISTQPFKKLYFLPGGEWYWCHGWTKGYLLSRYGYPTLQNRNAYTIEEMADGIYLFLEFKCRSYAEGGKPEIWVFKKVDSKAYTKGEIMQKDILPENLADDERVLGSWQACDFVEKIEDFKEEQSGRILPYKDLYWRSAEFLPGGMMQNCFKSKNEDKVEMDSPEVWRWTTGNVICNPRQTVSMYKFRMYGDTEYLFVQWKSGDYSFGGTEPFWYVFRRAENMTEEKQ